LAAARRALLQPFQGAPSEKGRQLRPLRGSGINGAWRLVMGFFGWREFKHRREVGG
jgi:hypothetical protein